MTTIITSIIGLPCSPYNGSDLVGVVITSGVPSYFKVSGNELDNIVSVNWYPKNPNSVLFETRELILIDDNEGTFMIKVLDNYLNINDRAGHISFRLLNDTTLTFPVITYGPVSATPLWTPPSQGLITG